MVEMHKLQIEVLKELWFHPVRRFSDMMAVTGLTSDDFKFHLRKLVKLGLVFKNDSGVYELTAEGKEFANRLDYERLAPVRQPKLTTATFVRRTGAKTGSVKYLFHQRLRQPFYEYWGVIGQPVRWGETFEQAAARGLRRQAGLDAPSRLKGFYRQRDLSDNSDTILEDKLFVVMEAEWQGGKTKTWPHAKARWMTADEYKKQPKRFDSCVEMLRLLGQKQPSQNRSTWFADNDTVYSDEDF